MGFFKNLGIYYLSLGYILIRVKFEEKKSKLKNFHWAKLYRLKGKIFQNKITFRF